MKVMAISLLILILPLASAIDFSFSSPDSAKLNESFSAVITASTSDNYDVKIFVEDNSTKKIISEIYNDGWKNPFYYLSSAFPAKSEFSIRIKTYSENADICARIRKTSSSKTSSSPFSESCRAIEIIPQDSQPTSNNPVTPETQENKNETAPAKIEQGTDFTPLPNNPPTASQTTSQPEPEKIFLNARVSSDSNFMTKDEKLRLFAVYSFTALAIVIIILLAFRKL